MKNSYVHNNPKQCKRRELGSRALVGMKIHSDDKIIIEIIKRKR